MSVHILPKNSFAIIIKLSMQFIHFVKGQGQGQGCGQGCGAKLPEAVAASAEGMAQEDQRE